MASAELNTETETVTKTIEQEVENPSSITLEMSVPEAFFLAKLLGQTQSGQQESSRVYHALRDKLENIYSGRVYELPAWDGPDETIKISKVNEQKMRNEVKEAVESCTTSK
jgi:hypothetical protein